MSTSAPPLAPGRRPTLKELSGRVPLHVRLISALLALVIIALVVISFVGVAEFRNYLQGQADAQLQELSAQTGQSINGVGNGRQSFGFAGYVVELMDSRGQLVQGWGTLQDPSSPGPKVPSTKSWLSANDGHLVTVPAAAQGPDNWRVLTHAVTFQETIGDVPFGPRQAGTVIVGVDLGSLDRAVNLLAKVDLVVSVIVVAAIAVVGVAMVRASLRPLAEIEGTAAAIAAGDLSRRVPEQDPKTEIGRLGRALNAMLAQIESAFYARARSEAAARRSEERMRQFVADASHELRTPLTAIRGYAEYYRQRGGVDTRPVTVQEPGPNGAEAAGNGSAPGTTGHGTDSHGTDSHSANSLGANSLGANSLGANSLGANSLGAGALGTGGLGSSGNERTHLTRPDMDRIMERVEQESSRMGGLVEDMLMLARLDEQRPVEHRPVDLLSLAADAVQDARIVAPGRAIELTVGTGAAFLVLGDEPRLRQVISNLMNNALKHTPEGTPIAARILPGHQGGTPGIPAAILEVTDQGPGLTREQAERVFERFYRADQARGRRTGGSGLGLAIVHALVAAHGGTVGVNTSPGKGATFWITLPLAPEAATD